MLTETIAIQVEGSLPGARLCIYIQEKSRELRIKERPLILLCPGGGYEWTSDREAEPMAVQFLAMGYHVAVLRYSCAPAVFPTALLELAEAMKLIHAHAAEWGVKEDQIYVEGCSAGGHLAASLGVFWHESWISERAGVTNEILRPAGLILCYPVITSGEYAHRGSFEALLKGQKTEEMLEKVSLEKQVTEFPAAYRSDAQGECAGGISHVSGRRTRVIHLYGAVYECGWIWCTGAVSELASAGAHLAGRKSALQNRYKCVRIATD